MRTAEKPVVTAERTADAATAVSMGSWVLSHITTVNDVLQVILTIVGILSGLAATYYYLVKARRNED